METFANRFKTLRLEKGLTQEQLADLFYLNKSSISRYESGKQMPEPQMIQKFADFFNISTDFLLARTNNRHQEQSSDNSRILNAVSNDPELLESVKELSERESMQLLFKQVKPLSDDEIARVMRIIKAIEDEEDRQDGV